MRAALLSLLVALAALAAAAFLVLPRLLDTAALEARLVQGSEAAFGTRLTARGPSALELFPTPRLSVERVAGAPVAGSGGAPAFTAERVELALDFWALLEGEAVVRRATLVRPVLRLAGPPSLERMPGELRALVGARALEALAVEDGTIELPAQGGRPAVRVDGLALEAVLAEDSGLLGIAADGRVEGETARLDLETGVRPATSVLPLRLLLTLGPKAETSRLSFRGAVHEPDRAPRLEGEAELRLMPGTRSAELARAWLPTGAGPLLGRTGLEGIAGRIRWQPDLLSLQDARLAFPLGDLTGGIELRGREARALEVRLQGGELRLRDELPLDLPASLLRPELPPELTGTFALRLAAMTRNGEQLRDVRLDAQLPGGGRIELRRLAAELPDNGHAELTGTYTPAPPGPRWQGRVQVDVQDPRGVLAWAGERQPFPDGRPRSLALTGTVEATPTGFGLTDADLRFDATRARGSLAVEVGKRLRVALAATADRLALDTYLADPEKGWRKLLERSAGGQLDLAVDLRLDRLGWRGIRAERVRLLGELTEGELTLKDLSAGDLAGLGGRVAGRLSRRTGEVQLTTELEVPQPLRTARALGLAPPMLLAPLGGFRASATLSGDTARADVGARLDGEALALVLTGTIGEPFGRQDLDLALSGQARDLRALLRRAGALGFGQPALDGPLAAEATLRRPADGPATLGLDLGLGQARVTGTLALATGEPLPRVTGALAATRLDLGTLLDLHRFLEGPLDLLPGPLRAWPGNLPRRPLAWNGLGAADLVLDLTAALEQGGRSLGEGRIGLTVKDRRLRLAPLDLPLAGGRLSGQLEAHAGEAGPRVSATLGLAGADVPTLQEALRAGDGLRGALDLDLDLATTGLSPRDLVGNLAGNAALRLRDGVIEGVVLLPSDGAADVLAPRLPFRLVSGDLRLERGVASTVEPGLVVESERGDLRIDARFDLLAWLLDATITPQPPVDAPSPEAPAVRLLGPPDRLQTVGAPAPAASSSPLDR